MTGRRTRLRGSAVPIGEAALVLLDAPTGRPAPLPFPGACFAHLDLARHLPLTTFAVGGPAWQLTVPVPARVELAGIPPLAAQTFYVDVQTLRVGATNGALRALDLLQPHARDVALVELAPDRVGRDADAVHREAGQERQAAGWKHHRRERPEAVEQRPLPPAASSAAAPNRVESRSSDSRDGA